MERMIKENKISLQKKFLSPIKLHNYARVNNKAKENKRWAKYLLEPIFLMVGVNL